MTDTALKKFKLRTGQDKYHLKNKIPERTGRILLQKIRFRTGQNEYYFENPNSGQDRSDNTSKNQNHAGQVDTTSKNQIPDRTGRILLRKIKIRKEHDGYCFKEIKTPDRTGQIPLKK